ncbi:MAG: S1C family serine protease [Pirellulales bacterium]
MRIRLLSLAAIALATVSAAQAQPDDAVVQAEAQRVAVTAKASTCVLAIFGSGEAGGGSGVVISPDGYALSNFHVTAAAGVAMKCGMADGRLYDAVIVGLDPTGDIALLKLLGREDFPFAEMGDSDRVQVGDRVFAAGNPFLLATDYQPTMTYGIISGVHRYQPPAGTLLEYTDCLQTDASINPGNSGGPLFNAAGQLIGINGRCSFEKRGRVNVGVGFAVSINQIKNFMGHLRSGRIVDHATLGASMTSDDQGRVVVSDILEDSDAYRRGLRFDDELIAFGGRPMQTVNGFKNVLGIFPSQWRVPLSFRHEGTRHDVLVRLQGLHREGELMAAVSGRPPMPPGQEPKPGEKPKEKPGDKKPRAKPPGDEEPKPKPKPGKLPAAPKSLLPPRLPPIVKQHYEAKPGYANYYFNKLNQDRVWKAFAARSDLAAAGPAWTLSGKLGAGEDFEIRLTDKEVLAKLPGGLSKLAVGETLDAAADPPTSGGLWAALHLWRRLLIEGPSKYGEVYYLGTVPLAGRQGLVDVLVGIHAGVECRFLFDPDNGDLVALEMFPGENADPCEILFSDYRDDGGRRLPHRLEVRHGDRVFGVFSVAKFAFEKGATQ